MNMTDHNKEIRAMLRFFPIYIIGYIFVERIYTPSYYHISHCALDDLIPFCEYFVIPYFLWHVIILAVCIYTIKHDHNRFFKLIKFFIACSVITFIIFIIFPSKQTLRPETFPRDNIFTDIVKLTYFIDTDTNVCPSMHVMGCVGLILTCWNIDKINNRLGHIVQVLIFTAICLSTVFLKQHSFVDVIVAIPVSILGWWISYGDEANFRKSEISKMLKVIFVKGKIFTIPNIMSLFRICLIPAIIMAYKESNSPYSVTAIVALSGLTDVLDGMIARKFNMISPLGKILDPIADKLTQLTLIYILTSKYPVLWNLIFIIAIKECVQALFGYLMLKRNMTVHSSQWFGKLSTVLLYAMSIMLILFPDTPRSVVNTATAVCAAALLLALILYTRFYLIELYPDTLYKIRDTIFKGSGILLWVIAIAVVLLNYDKLTSQNIADMMPGNMLLAAFVLLLLFALKSITIVFSSSVLYAATAIVFDLPMALIINFIGILIMSFIPYSIGANGGYNELSRLTDKYKKIKALHEKEIKNEFLYVFLVRINVLINYDIGSMYMGAKHIDSSSYFLGSICGMLPSMILFTVAGTGLNNENYVMLTVSVVIKIVLTILSFILFKREESK